MPKINIYSRETIIARTKHRSGETKLGETIHTIPQNTSWQTYLNQDTAKFVVLGIPEDIGVRANHGRGGAYAAWKPSLDFLLNMQSNQFCHGEEILVLGH
ncbi:MAG: arginase, partial [Chitinophagales bacterium]